MKPIKYGFFISDAGSSNQILHKILNENLNCEIFGHEPGLTLAESLGLQAKNFSEFNFESEFDFYVFGSYLFNREQDELIEKLFLKGAKVVGVLDHWVNFENRWVNRQPLEIWVTDKFAYSLANQFFPDSEIKLFVNYYLQYVEREYKYLNSKKINKGIGFLGKRGKHIIEQGVESGLIFNCSCSFIANLLTEIGQEIVFFREHPSHAHNECFEYLKLNFPAINVVNASKLSMSDFLARSYVVYGELTYALYISKELGIKTICLEEIPPEWRGPKFQVYKKFNL
jgi:hypothetical protein